MLIPDLLYVLLVAGVLLVNMRVLPGSTQRLMVNLEVLIFAVPAFLILTFRIHRAETDKTAQGSAGRGSTAGQGRNTAEGQSKELPDMLQPCGVSVSCNPDIFAERLENSGLSGREREVAWLLYRGYTNRQIGEELYIAETTVKKHVSHIYEKLQVQSRKEFREKMEKEKIHE